MDEKKNYSVVGTVTIGTDEYRDLIESLKDARHEEQKSNSARWEQYNKATKLETELKAVVYKLEELETFVRSDEDISTKFKLWRIERDMRGKDA